MSNAHNTSEIALTVEQVRELMGWSERHVRRVAERESWKWRISKSRARNGKTQRDYLLSSLPPAAQIKYSQSGVRETAIVPAAATLSLFAGLAEPTSSTMPAVTSVPEELQPQVKLRYAAIEPLLEFRNGRQPKIRTIDGRLISSIERLAAYVGSQQIPPVEGRTVRRWFVRFLKNGYTALADQGRKDKGQKKFFEKHLAAMAFIEGKYLNERLSFQMSWEALVREWPKVERKGQPPSYATVRNYLRGLPDPLKVRGRIGKRAYESTCSPFIQREDVPVMDWWVGDHREFDVLVWNSVFDQPAYKAFRVWMTAFFDWGSRKLVGFCFSPNPNWRTISSALRMAVLSHGMPKNLYWDNGKDYTKVHGQIEEIKLSQEASALLQRGNVNITTALPFHPRSKPIESWFARWSKRFDPIWGAGYVGNSTANRPESAGIAEKQHAEFLAGKRSASPFRSDVQFLAGAIQWIEEDNAAPRKMLEGRTPNEVMERQRPDRTRVPVNPRLLDILLSERIKRTVRPGGEIRMDSMIYEPTETSLFALDALKGRDVIVVRDPYNLQEATANEPGTMRFIGELCVKEFVAQCPNGRITRDQIQAKMRRQRSLRKGYSEYLASLQAIATNQGWPTEEVALLERAGVATGTDGQGLRGLPGAARPQLPAPRSRRVLQPAFVSDAVAEDADVFRDVKVED